MSNAARFEAAKPGQMPVLFDSADRALGFVWLATERNDLAIVSARLYAASTGYPVFVYSRAQRFLGTAYPH